MKTKEKVNPIGLKGNLRIALKQTQQELEEMALQFSLGKAEAADKFEETKKEFKTKIHAWKGLFQEQSEQGKQNVQKVIASLEEAQVQLSLGKAEAKEAFEKQKKNIIQSLDTLERAIKANPTMNEWMIEVKSESERLKLKLEILKLKYELKKFRITDDFKSAMKDVKNETEKVLDKVEEKWDDTKSRYTDFSDEMSHVYKHFNKAIKSLF